MILDVDKIKRHEKSGEFYDAAELATRLDMEEE